MQTAGIIIFRSKAYVPTDANIEGGGSLDQDPVYVTELTTSDLARTVEQMLISIKPTVPALTRDMWKNRIDPVLKATSAKSWKQLAREGASYTIVRDAKEIVIYMSMVDNKGRFVHAPQKTRHYPPDESVITLAEAILSDWSSQEHT